MKIYNQTIIFIIGSVAFYHLLMDVHSNQGTHLILEVLCVSAYIVNLVPLLRRKKKMRRLQVNLRKLALEGAQFACKVVMVSYARAAQETPLVKDRKELCLKYSKEMFDKIHEFTMTEVKDIFKDIPDDVQV